MPSKTINVLIPNPFLNIYQLIQNDPYVEGEFIDIINDVTGCILSEVLQYMYEDIHYHRCEPLIRLNEVLLNRVNEIVYSYFEEGCEYDGNVFIKDYKEYAKDYEIVNRTAFIIHLAVDRLIERYHGSLTGILMGIEHDKDGNPLPLMSTYCVDSPVVMFQNKPFLIRLDFDRDYLPY